MECQSAGDLIRELTRLAPGMAEYEIVREEPRPRTEPDLTLFPMLAGIIRERDPAGDDGVRLSG